MYLPLCARHRALLSGRLSEEMGLRDSVLQIDNKTAINHVMRRELLQPRDTHPEIVKSLMHTQSRQYDIAVKQRTDKVA